MYFSRKIKSSGDLYEHIVFIFEGKASLDSHRCFRWFPSQENLFFLNHRTVILWADLGVPYLSRHIRTILEKILHRQDVRILERYPPHISPFRSYRGVRWIAWAHAIHFIKRYDFMFHRFSNRKHLCSVLHIKKSFLSFLYPKL